MAHRRKLAVCAMFLHSKQQNSYQGTLGTLEQTPKWSRASLGPSIDPFDFWEYFRLCKPILSLAPPNISEPFFGHCQSINQSIYFHCWTIINVQRINFIKDPWWIIFISSFFKIYLEFFIYFFHFLQIITKNIFIIKFSIFSISYILQE